MNLVGDGAGCILISFLGRKRASEWMLFGVINGNLIGRAEVKTHLLGDRTTKYFTIVVWPAGR